MANPFLKGPAAPLWDQIRSRAGRYLTPDGDPDPAGATLLDFTRHTFPEYRAEPAHALIASTLDAVVRGEILRLMIFAPPQHGKSELTSVRLPALWLGKRPEDPVILTSYAASL